jgi:hypothetical protein
MKSIIKGCLLSVIRACKKYQVDFYEILKEIESET